MYIYIFIQKGADNFEIEHKTSKHANFWLRLQYPLTIVKKQNIATHSAVFKAGGVFFLPLSSDFPTHPPGRYVTALIE